MRFDKPPETIDQQIDRLVRRGMEVSDRDYAHNRLHHLNYYRLRGYWIPFEAGPPDDKNHHFREGTTFERVVDLYVFDRELRLLLLDAVECIEVSMRSQWAYHLSHEYGAHAHLNCGLFYKQQNYNSCLDSLMNGVERSRETFIKHFIKNYEEPLPPTWAVVEIMLLGQLSKWYRNLRSKSLRQKIADSYKMDEGVFASFIHHLTLIRNICAHHNRLWNRHFTITFKLPRKKPAKLRTVFNMEAPRQLYNSLAMVAYVTDIVSRDDQWKHRLLDILNKHKHVPTAPMGFPQTWQELNFWEV